MASIFFRRTAVRYVSLMLLLAFSQCKQPLVPALIDNNPTRDDNLVTGNPAGAKPSEPSLNAYLTNYFPDLDCYLYAYINYLFSLVRTVKAVFTPPHISNFQF